MTRRDVASRHQPPTGGSDDMPLRDRTGLLLRAAQAAGVALVGFLVWVVADALDLDDSDRLPDTAMRLYTDGREPE